MTEASALQFFPLADSALLIRLANGEAISRDTVEAVWRTTAAIEQARIPGVVDIVPAYTTILLMFDPMATDPARLENDVRAAISASSHTTWESREITIPVAYGGEFGPDLEFVAHHTGLSPQEVVHRHATATYIVACMGFAPGWAYLLGLPPELKTPRLANPRTRVPAGSVGIGGAQTGVYPLETPGGWRLIGRTPLRMFDPERAEPALLRPGDAVRFVPITPEQFRSIERNLSSGASKIIGSDTILRAPVP
ncbi:MAG: allophanate hydrolase [Thermomicrobiales bacterium]|nr:MAG: allophanate hydrolase [Thermomicrobiales bacterium]